MTRRLIRHGAPKARMQDRTNDTVAAPSFLGMRCEAALLNSHERPACRVSRGDVPRIVIASARQ